MAMAMAMAKGKNQMTKTPDLPPHSALPVVDIAQSTKENRRRRLSLPSLAKTPRGPTAAPARRPPASNGGSNSNGSRRRASVDSDGTPEPDASLLDAACGLRRLLSNALLRAGVADDGDGERSRLADAVAASLEELYVRTPEQLRDALASPEARGQVAGCVRGMLLPAVEAELERRAAARAEWARLAGAGAVVAPPTTCPSVAPRKLNEPLLRRLHVARVDVTHLAEIDQISQTFYARLFVILRIKGGANDPDLTSEYAGFPFDDDGRPTFRPSAYWYLDQIDFPNGKEILTIESKVTRQGNDLQLVKRVEGHFFERFDLHNFPFDRQDLTVTIGTNCACEGPVPVEFVEADDPQLGVDTINFPHGDIWDLSPTLSSTFATVGASRRRRFPAVHLRAGVRRRCGFVLVNAAMPVSVISFLSLTTFFVPPEDTADRLELSITILLTAVAFKFTTSSYLPQISYMTLVDIFTILCTLIIVAVSLCHAVLGVLDRWVEASYDVLGVVNIVFLATVLVAWIGVQWWFIHKARMARNLKLLRHKTLKRQSGRRQITDHDVAGFQQHEEAKS